MKPILFLLFFGAGYWSWGFVEYLIHGILSHKYRTPVSPVHWGHHVDPRRVFTSPVAAIVVVPILFMLFSVFVGYQFSAFFMMGLLLGYAKYEYFHWSIHFREPKTEKQKLMRKHHLAHHFCDSKMYHGVTTTFWDKVFNTVPDEETVKKDYASVEDTPVMEGESNFKDTYLFRDLRTMIRDYGRE